LRKPSAAVLNRIPIAKARINLGQLAKRAHLNNEYYILEKGRHSCNRHHGRR